jgi:hypothetical protein
MRRATIILATLLLTAACGSMGDLGSLGDILGSSSPTQQSDVKGSVTNVDTNARRIDLDVSYVNNLRSSGSNQRGSIYYDSETRVVFQGNDYQVTDLERGDEIEVIGVNDNGRYLARTITVVRDASR